MNKNALGQAECAELSHQACTSETSLFRF